MPNRSRTFREIFQASNPLETEHWRLLSERAAVLSRQCAQCATQDGVPEVVRPAAEAAAKISEQLARHLPQELRPA